MNKYKKTKTGCLKYFIFAVAVIFAVAYVFTIAAPKTSQMAKKEVINKIFGINTTDSAKKEIVGKKDSVIALGLPSNNPIKEKADSSIITIPVEITEHSVYVMAKVNGVDMKFMIDTGCSDLQITSAEFYYMKHLGLISENEIVDEALCVYADNSKNKCPVIKIKTISIGSIELKDVSCCVQENAESSLLLGQGILKQLGEVSIDYNSSKLKIRR